MTAIDIAKMPVAERLKLMEALWDSLSHPAGADLESPAWHGQALLQAENALATGTAHFVDWSVAREQLRGSGKT